MSKRLLRLFAALCLLAVWFGLIPAAQAQFCVPPPAGLIAWWPASGDATDLFGANNGTLQGGATANVAGEVGTAFKFDGANGFVQIPNSAALEPTNLTVEAWVRFDSLNSTQNSAPGHQYIVFKQNSRSSSFEGYDLGKHRVGTQGDFFYFMVASASGTEVKVNSTNPISTNVWYHVAGVRGPDYIQLYLNGQLQGQTNVSFPQDYGHLPLYFGTTGQSSWDGKLAGELDEVSLYNRPLSSNEIQGIYLAGSDGKCESPPTILPSTTDLWDISQGSVVTGTSGAHAPNSDIRDMFGGTFSQTESGNTVFADGKTASFVHYVEWQTPGPVTVSSFNLFASGDGAQYEREFSQFVLKAKSGPLATNYDLTLYTLVVTNHPYSFVDAANQALVSTNITPVTAQYFRAEFTQYTSGTGYDGPRVIELDGFGSNALTIVTQPSNQTVTVGASGTFVVGATGTGPLSFQWQVNGTNISPAANPTATNFTLVLTNVQPNLSGNLYSVIVSDLNGSTTSSNALLAIVSSQIHYVDVNGANPVYPYTSWSTAATNIQDAVDASAAPDQVLVTNGIYQFGGRPAHGSVLTNRLIVTNAITVQSINGPVATIILGFRDPRSTNGPLSVRCAYLAADAQLIGFTLTNGATQAFSQQVPFDEDGGGVCCTLSEATLFNCVISGNSAYNTGGGAAGGTLINCILAGNTCKGPGSGRGGGAASCVMTNCIITNNVAYQGGGALASSMNGCIVAGNSGGGLYSSEGSSACTLNNCTIAFNSGVGVIGAMNEGTYTLKNCLVYSNTGPNYGYATSLYYCCTSPLPPGPGNITNAPLFVNPAGSDFHLQSNSPCINSGNNAYVTTTTDLDGNPRISGGTVDIGAYEFQNPASIISYAWLQQYGLPIDGSADFLDSDHNGMNNWQKWIAGLDPTNPSSILQMLSPVSTTNPPGLVVTWQSAPNVNYYLQRATNLSAQPAFHPLATNLPGQTGTTSYTDTNAPAPGPYFYRVGVQH